MSRFIDSVKTVFKAIHKVITSIINFILIIPIYFIGAGLSRLFYRSKQKESKDTYWQTSEISYKKQDFEKLF